MDNSFFAYLQQLELFIFFSGYPLLYLLINSLSSVTFISPKILTRAKRLLPYTYALAGILFVGFELKNLYPDLSLYSIEERIQHPYLIVWSLLSLVFWIPFFNKRILYSFLHSLVIFILFIREIYLVKTMQQEDNSRLLNDMRIYTISILLYCILLLVVYFLSLFRDHFFSKNAR